MKSKIEIIDETVAYYSEDPNRRAVVMTTCKYRTPDGRMCAFGRCMTEESLELYGDFQGGVMRLLLKCYDRPLSDVILLTTVINTPLKEEYQGHELTFWTNIQRLHDDFDYWNSDGLTEEGKEYVEVMKNKYKGL
jgi:hypothetical protein